MKSRVAVVTGASSGIGAATVRVLTARGWTVIAAARRADKLAALAAQTGCHTVVADLTRASDVEVLSAAVAEHGALTALVNNAGGALGGAATVEHSEAADWLRMFEINVLTTKRVTSALLPALREGALRDGGASILSVGSTAGLVSYEGGGGYNAAKFALHGLMLALRLELAGEPIRVMEIAPGMVKTDEFALTRFAGDQSKVDALYDDVRAPLVAEDVAESIAHLLELPAHVNVDHMILRPTAQAAQHKLIRGELKVSS
ncbi:MAG: SDR family oxidoreductase [Microbacteriaceae bacterium]|nr:SDR family oxidoreductase [Microbacteriaceae bacterium]